VVISLVVVSSVVVSLGVMGVPVIANINFDTVGLILARKYYWR
jgi:hypothetical protein